MAEKTASKNGYVQAAVRSKQLVSAARTVLCRDGVSRTSLRMIAAEAGVPLGTLQHVFPSKEQLLRAVIEDVVDDIAGVLKRSAEVDRGLAHAIGGGLTNFWNELVNNHNDLQLVLYELVTHALRTPGLESLARAQYDLYERIVAQWCQEAAAAAGEQCAIPYGRLARIIVANVDGLVLQYVCDPDAARAREDLDTVIGMIVGLAAPRSS